MIHQSQDIQDCTKPWSYCYAIIGGLESRMMLRSMSKDVKRAKGPNSCQNNTSPLLPAILTLGINYHRHYWSVTQVTRLQCHTSHCQSILKGDQTRSDYYGVNV